MLRTLTRLGNINKGTDGDPGTSPGSGVQKSTSSSQKSEVSNKVGKEPRPD